MIGLNCVLLLTPDAAFAQTRSQATSRQRRLPEKPDTKVQRRQNAQALLGEIEDSARDLDQLFYRARIQAVVADILWDLDHQRSASMFERAWQSAIASDKADNEDHLNETGQALSDQLAYSDARNEVLKLAAHRDPEMAQRFLKEMNRDEQAKPDTAGEGQNLDPWGNISPAGARALDLAGKLLNDGDVAAAVRIASPVLQEQPNGRIIEFILALTARDAASGSALYGQLLARSVQSPAADWNTVLLLSAPVVSPALITNVDANGSLHFKSVSTGKNPPVLSGPARRGFYDAAIVIISRQPINTEDAGRNAAQYFVLSRLLPFYEREAPELAVNIKGRLDIVSRHLDTSRRANLDVQSVTQRVSSDNAGDPLRFQAEQLSHERDSAARDQLAVSMVRSAVRNKLWERALRAGGEISDPSLKSAVGNLITVSRIESISEAFNDEKDSDYDNLLAFLAKSAAPPFALSFGYSEVAVIAARRDGKKRALELLNEAERYAGMLTSGSDLHIAASGYLATTMARFDKRQAWRLLRETVKSVNGSETYSGDEESLSLNDGPADNISSVEVTVNGAPFRIATLFASMARLDFDEATLEARSIKPAIPRLLALISVARTGLDSSATKRARAGALDRNRS